MTSSAASRSERLLFTSWRMLDNLRFKSSICSTLKVIGLLGRPMSDDGMKDCGKQAGIEPQRAQKGIYLTAKNAKNAKTGMVPAGRRSPRALRSLRLNNPLCGLF